MFFKKIFKKKELVDDWISFTRQKKDKKNFLKLNYAFSSFGKLKGYKYFLKITIFLDEKLEKNHNIIYEIEDKLSEVLEKDFKIIFVGTKKTEKKYSIYFYSKNDKNILSETINKAMISFPNTDFSISIKKDKFWDKYFKNLLPSTFEFQKYQNEKKFYSLDKKYLEKKVEIYYFLSYRNEKVSNYFKTDLKHFGFDILGKGTGKRKNFPFALKISKKDVLNLQNINNSAQNLISLSEKYNFKYEGWILKG